MELLWKWQVSEPEFQFYVVICVEHLHEGTVWRSFFCKDDLTFVAHWFWITLFSTDLEICCQNAQSHQPVFVPCPNVSIENGKFQLFKNQTILCQLEDNQMICNQTKIEVQPCKSELNQTVGFNLTGPEIARDQAIYRCNVITYYPPPYALKQSNERILIFTESKYQGWNLKSCTLSCRLSNPPDHVSS